MSKLLEKFKSVISSQTHVVTLQNENLAVSGINKASEQCVEITEQVVIGFMDWLRENPDIMINDETHEYHTTSELFKQYIK